MSNTFYLINLLIYLFVACGDVRVDMVFLVDESGSICGDDPKSIVNGRCQNWTGITDFLNVIVEHLTINQDKARVAMVAFGNEARLIFNLTTHNNKKGLQDAISRTKPDLEKTNTADGLKFVKDQILVPTNGDRTDVPNVIIGITDGVANVHAELVEPYAKQLKDKGTTFLLIGVTDKVDSIQIATISSPPQKENETFWLVNEWSRLKNIQLAAEILAVICKSTYNPAMVLRGLPFNSGK